MQRLPRFSRVPCEEEEEEGAAAGRGSSTTHECCARRPAAVKYAGGAAAVTHRRQPLPAAPPGACRARGRPRPPPGTLVRLAPAPPGRSGDNPEPSAAPADHQATGAGARRRRHGPGNPPGAAGARRGPPLGTAAQEPGDSRPGAGPCAFPTATWLPGRAAPPRPHLPGRGSAAPSGQRPARCGGDGVLQARVRLGEEAVRCRMRKGV